MLLKIRRLINFLNPWYQQRRYDELLEAYIQNSDLKQREINHLRDCLDFRTKLIHAYIDDLDTANKTIKYYQDWFANPANYPQGNDVQAL